MVNQQWEEPLDKTKPFSISKHVVWEAYLRVKANKGAAGIDEQSLADFEEDLKNNLYKIWNRMSSGTYFPPPVRTVSIPKANGGQRKLGIPIVRSHCTSYNRVRDFCFGKVGWSDLTTQPSFFQSTVD